MSEKQYRLTKCQDWKIVSVNGKAVEIPKNWNFSNFTDAVQMLKEQKKYQIASSLIELAGKNAVITQEKDYINGYSNHENFISSDKDNSFVVFGDHTTSLKYIDFNFVLGGDGTKVFNSKTGSTKFLYFCLIGKIKPVGYSRHFSFLKEFSFAHPCFTQQSAIASILTKQEDLISNYKTTISQEKQKLQFLMDHLLSGKIRVRDHGVDEQGEPVLELYNNTEWKSAVVNGKAVEIPEEWEMVKISDAFEVTRGKVISKDYIQENKGDYPVYSSATENKGCIGFIDYYMYDGEYITWTTDGIYAGSVFYRKEKFNCTNICGVIKSKDKSSLSGIFYFMREEFPRHATKLANSKLMSNVVTNILIKTPQPKEQSAISIILTKQEDLINKYEDLVKKEELRMQWLMDNLLSGKYLVEEVES